MFDATRFGTFGNKLISSLAVVAVFGAISLAAPNGNQAEARGFSVGVGPTYDGHARATQYGISQADVYRTLRRRGFYHVRNVSNHGDYYTAQGIRGRYHYLVYVNARTGRIFRVNRIR